MGFILTIVMISSTGDIGVISNQYFDRPACVNGAKVITDSLKAGMDATNKPATYSTKKVSSFTWSCTPLSLPDTEQPDKQ